jgi:outer membrane protein OmpA-like peptidoglycan-associated protein
LVLWNTVRVGLNLPIALAQDGTGGAVNGYQVGSPSKAGIGDLRLGADVRLLGTYGGPFTAAIGAQVFLPTGNRDQYDGDGSTRLLPRVSIAGDIGPFVYAAMVGMLVRTQSDSFAGNSAGSELALGASAGLRVLDRKLVVGPELYGNAIVTHSTEALPKPDGPLEVLFGGHYTAGDFRLGAGAGPGLTHGFGTPEVRVVGMFEWAPQIKEAPPVDDDRDKDGIKDAVDACPDDPGPATDDPKTTGCPDRDKDGVVDKEDACVDVPGVRTSDPKTNGCPSDRDKDGILDADDACPDDPGPKTDDPTTTGCPDRDKDGIIDKLDACVDVPGVKTNDPKTNGCPPDPDRDKDGIPNEKDACPDEAGPADPDPKKNGCPKAFVKGNQIVIVDQVKFKTNSAQIVPGKDSESILQAVLEVLKKHPEIKGLRVEGHTDNRGNPAANKTLSDNRAKSVVKWLVAHGIAASTLSSEGFGQDKPIDTNDTDAGRRNNRRVEFHIADGK